MPVVPTGVRLDGAPSVPPQVFAVHRSPVHAFSKQTVDSIELVPGQGVLGDAHFGFTVQHRSRVAKDPWQPNLRQVHLLQAELLTEVGRQGFDVAPGQMGENITTTGMDLLALGTATRLRIGPTALVEVTGLRNPCAQIEAFQAGLLGLVVGRSANGDLVRRAGVMAVVLQAGIVCPGDVVEVVARPAIFNALKPV